MTLRAILVLVATAIWFLLGAFLNWVCRDCVEQTDIAQNQNIPPAVVDPNPDSSRIYGPLVFNWSNEEPVVDAASFAGFRDSILNEYEAGDSLIIRGLHFLGEENRSSSDNLGLARAQQLKPLFETAVETDKIVLRSEEREKKPGMEQYPFSSAEFEIKSGEMDLPTREVVYFPYNSTSFIPRADLDNYLDRLAGFLNQTDKSIQIIGHADTIGGERFNQRLGLQRAEAIRDMLIERGVDAQQISTDSEGASRPASPNTTEEGRSRNRRVEIIIQ